MKDEPVKLDFGASYGLKTAKAAALPDVDIEEFTAQPITQTQVSKVVQAKVSELEYCWLRLPASKRVAASTNLRLLVEASGTVAGAFAEGTLPAGVGACIEKLASRWTFPAADAGCEIEHALSFNAKSDALR
jgi:hypothetical protein